MRRSFGFWLLCLFLVALGASIGWAVDEIFSESDVPLVEASYTLVEVRPGEVSSSVNLNALTWWPVANVAVNRAVGTVTAVSVERGSLVGLGHVVYRVNERPVVLATGDVPAFRDLERNVRGTDVAQLQEMLKALGHYTDDSDGVFGRSLEIAVKAWQRDLGIADDGVVRLGDIAFVPELPIKVVLDEEVLSVGRFVVGGEPAIGIMPDDPVFAVNVTPQQVSLITTGSHVTLSGEVGESMVHWQAEVGVLDVDPAGPRFGLLPTANETICGDDCWLIPVGGQWPLQATVVTVAPTAGLVVPLSALTTAANGAVAVIDATGTAVEVEVVAASRGLVVVVGVTEGTLVRVPAN